MIDASLNRFEAAVRLLYPDEMTPRAKHLFEGIIGEERAKSVVARADLVRLLHYVDGHLGLAVHRGLDDLWKSEAESLITQVRKTIEEIDGG